MNESLTAAEISPAARNVSLPGLLTSAVVLPAVIAGVDYAILGRQNDRGETNLQSCLLFGWYMVQVGIVGWVVGRSIAQPVVRWIVFGWVLLLINLLTLTLSMRGSGWNCPQFLPPAALLAGQIGLCTVWAFFGDARWPLRWPAMLLLVAALFWLWSVLGGRYSSEEIWGELLVLQVLTLATLCGLLRLKGFHLRRMLVAPPAVTGDRADRRVLQFNIKHVLIWTTTLALMLGVARGLDLLNWQAARDLVRGGIVWKLTIATASAMVIIVALWAALGREHWLARYAVGLVFSLTAGSGLAMWAKFGVAALNNRTGWWNQASWGLRIMYEIGWWWLGWLFLANGILTATLIILRVLDYRLVKTQRVRRAA
jgi:hypothetical protein